jgi:glycosyltransferase involved in cell wall biosynthesis
VSATTIVLAMRMDDVPGSASPRDMRMLGNRRLQPPKLLYVIETEAPFETDRIFASLRESFDVVEVWTTAHHRHRKDVLFGTRRRLVIDELRNFARLLRTLRLYRGRWLIVSMTGHYSSLALARLLRILGRQPRVLLFNFYLHGLGTRGFVKRTLRVLLGSHVRIVCQTEDEVRYFTQIREDVTLDYVPYCQGPLMKDEWIGNDDYIFSGGHSNRDYDLLMKCAARFPQQRFIIACSNLNRIVEPPLPNVLIMREQSWEAFHVTLGHSRIVVVPLRQGVGSSGQMVTLAAMEAGKPTIVPDVGGLSQYIDEGATGFVYRLGDQHSLCELLARCLSNPKALEEVGQAARASYLLKFVRTRFEEAVIAGIRAEAGVGLAL